MMNGVTGGGMMWSVGAVNIVGLAVLRSPWRRT